ncbi:MAG: helix-hairpin-helix domain-containing protein [Holophagaceae bacterium]|nr:helix-hairpin-helix domain-containing protein [Holophagaceae bacterium]
MLHWLKKRLKPAQRRGDGSEPVEPLPVSNSPGFHVHFMAGGSSSTRPAGKRFHAKLYLWTPLSVLQAHGRFAIQAEAPVKDEIPAEFGFWVDEPAAPAGWEPPELEEESDAGPVKPSMILPFLKAFRGIAESDLEPREQSSKFNRMHLVNPAWKPFVDALRRPSEIHPDGAPDLASVWFCPHLEANVNGVGPKLAAALYQAGFLTPKQVRESSDNVLLNVPGINRGVLKRIRQSW